MTETMAPQISFLDELREQRWDDHRYYHRSYVNQTLHLISASCFVATYILLPIHPIGAALFGWLVAMWPRQIGHVFFEPREYDEINKATFAHKEAIKVGFNLRRKLALFVVWLAVPATLYISPTAFGALPDGDYLHNLGVIWLALAAIGLVARTLWLCATRSVQTGAAWFTKILTDPFHDILIYHKAPLHLLKGEWLDPMHDVQDRR